VLTNAELRFFNVTNFVPSVLPRNIGGVLKVADEVKASGSTAPAASLWESYAKYQYVKCFVIVTDEEENRDCNGYKFCALFKKYKQEINNDVKLVFVSFLRGQNGKAQMVDELRNADVECTQFKLDSSRPDLTKLDTFLGLLSSETDLFKKQCYKGAEKLDKGEGFKSFIQDIHPEVVKKLSIKSPQSSVSFKFSIHYHAEFESQLVLSGSIPELGLWNLEKSQKLVWSEGDVWTMEISLKASQTFEYKYVVFDPKSKKAQWEATQNRKSPKIAQRSMVIADKWEVVDS